MTGKITIRRAEPSDAQAVLALSTGQEAVVQRRFSSPTILDEIPQIIETSPLSFVGVQATTNDVVGFISLVNGPPANVAYSSKAEDLHVVGLDTDSNGASVPFARGNWKAWVDKTYSTASTPIYISDTKFVSLFIANSEHNLSFFEAACSAIFSFVPSLANLAYLLPPGVLLYPPFSALTPKGVKAAQALEEKSKKPAYTSNNGVSAKKPQAYFTEVPAFDETSPYTLQLCSRKHALPAFKVRRARVEDCDDILPMLRSQNLLNISNADYYLSNLLDGLASDDQPSSHSPINLPLVAEFNGNLVAFMNLSTEFNMQVAREVYETSIFQDFQVAGEIGDHAFCISLLCVQDAFAQFTYKIVEEGFSRYKNRPYCLITVPTSCPDIPLLRSFSKVPVRHGRVASHSLFVTSRYCLHRHLEVGALAVQNIPELESGLLSGLSYTQETVNQLSQAVSDPNSDLKAFIAHDRGSVVGLAILQRVTDSKPFVDQFDIDDFLNPKIHFSKPGHYLLQHICMNPLFEPQAKWFVEEILRQSGNSALLYCCSGDKDQIISARRVTSKYFVPVRRRRQIRFPKNSRDGVPVPSSLLGNLQLISSSLVYESKVMVDSRILVLGASDVGLSFLENLVYNSHLHFSSIMLLDSDGLSSAVAASPSFNAPGLDSNAADFSLTSSGFSALELQQLGLDHYVQLLQGDCCSVDRVAKTVQLTNGAMIAYDYLILCPGVQYQLANLGESQAHQFVSAFSFTKANFESISSLADKLGLSADRSASLLKAVVYGRGVDAFHCAQVLLQKGIHPSALNIILPNHSGERVLDVQVEDKLVKLMIDLGAQVYFNSTIQNFKEYPDTLLELEFTHGNGEAAGNVTSHITKIGMFVYADKKNSDPNTLHMLNNSSLVYDGRLVIDKYFRTKDLSIFAAGTITKYSSFYDTEWTHANHSSREVGAKLAEVLLPLFDPTLEPYKIVNDNNVLPFKEAKFSFATMPGGNYYFHFSQPTLTPFRDEVEENVAGSKRGRELLFGVDERSKNGAYIRIRTDKAGFIRAMTYFGSYNVPAENLLCLYNLHQNYLNRLIDSYDEGLIEDFATFCEESWALPIFHDRFREFLSNQRRQILANPSKEVSKIVSMLKTIGLESDGEQDDVMLKTFLKSADRAVFDEQMFEFVSMALYKDKEDVNDVFPRDPLDAAAGRTA